MDRATITRALVFISAAAGPAMVIVLGLRLAGFLDSGEALLDLAVLLAAGVLATVAARLFMR